MKAIDFVVRDSAGGLQRGVVPGEAQGHVIQAGAGQEISLNLRQIDLHTQMRVGNDLVITLADGREITILFSPQNPKFVVSDDPEVV